MAKVKTIYICSSCGFEASKWMGKCMDCNSWNTFEESVKQPANVQGQRASISSGQKARKITDIISDGKTRFSTNMGELDRVLGGGVVQDSVVLMSAQPGTGKSTMLLQVSQHIAVTGKTVLYCSGEESDTQIKMRGDRLFGDKLSENIYLKATNSMDEIKAEVNSIKPDMLIVDSIQTVALQEFMPSRAGGGVQVVECTNALISMAKGADGRTMPVFIVGQVTKNNDLAGVKYLSHAVDVVLSLEGDGNTQLRVLRADKNRHGSTDEVGLFEMTSKGILSVDNPNELFTTKRDIPMVGCALSSVSEGNRSFVIEVQSLVTKCVYGNPIRNAIGLRKDLVHILAAILEARTNRGVSDRDINLQIVGGFIVKDVAANLGILMSVVSSHIAEPIPDGYVFIGEVGLTGEVTNVQHLASRIKAIDRYGYKKVFIPRGSLREKLDLVNVEVVEVRTLDETIKNVFKVKK